MPETSKCSLGQHFFLLIDLWENFEIVISQGHKIKVKTKSFGQSNKSNFSSKIQVILIYFTAKIWRVNKYM